MMRRFFLAALLLCACGKNEPAPPAPNPTPTKAATPSTTSSGQQQGERDEKPAFSSHGGVQVAAVVDGAPGRAMTGADLAKVKAMQVEGDSGEETRDAWSARDVAAALYGPTARITSIKGEDGKSVTIDQAAWRDAARIPVLRINRRGLVKFFWSTTTGAPLVAGEVRGVTEIQVATK
jgi:hypothetical protein